MFKTQKMNFQKDLNTQNNLQLNNSNSNNFSSSNNKFIPLVQTSFPITEINKINGISTNDYQELIRPIPFPLFFSLNNTLWERNYLYNFNIGSNINNINLNRNIQNGNNIYGKKAQIINNDLYLPNFNIFENNKEDSNNKYIFPKIEQFNDNNNFIFKENDDSNFLSINDTFEEKSSNCNSKKLFIINRKKKRGRKCRHNSRIHDCNSLDNILRKIQIHYITFIISLTNDLINTFSPYNINLEFKNLDYHIKNRITYNWVKMLEKMKIKDILQQRISSKYKKYNIKKNKEIFLEVSNLFPFLNDYFNMTYLEVFNKFYIKSDKVINLEGKSIYLSENTKVYSDLLEKNKNIAEKIRIIVRYNFAKKENKHLFIIHK